MKKSTWVFQNIEYNIHILNTHSSTQKFSLCTLHIPYISLLLRIDHFNFMYHITCKVQGENS